MNRRKASVTNRRLGIGFGFLCVLCGWIGFFTTEGTENTEKSDSVQPQTKLIIEGGDVWQATGKQPRFAQQRRQTT